MNTLPKLKCPPAKPPRRKLSYSSESGKGTSDSSAINGSPENSKLMGNRKQCSKVLNQVDLNHHLPESLDDISRNQNISKSSSSASSASKESCCPSTDLGSDYGSFQGDHPNFHSSDYSTEHLIHQWPTISSKAIFKTPQKHQYKNSHLDSSTSYPHCCSSSTPIKSPHNLMPHSTPSNHLNNSVYYTPPCNTPCSTNYFDKERNLCSSRLRESLCGQKDKSSCCGIERRHNSDPQISLERRPSRRLKTSGMGKTLLGRSKRNCIEETSRRKKRSQSFVCSQHHLHHHHHEEVPESPRVLVFPHPSICCLDTWLNTKPKKSDTLEDICHRIWNKHQNQSQSDRNSSKTTFNQNNNFSELLSEIYYAQKERDKAIQEHLQMVTDQRNKLLTEVEDLKQIIFRQNFWKNECNEDESDCDAVGLDQLLKGLDDTCSPTKLELHKEQILAKVNRATKQRKHLANNGSSFLRKMSSEPQSLMDELSDPAAIWNCDGFVCQKVSEERSKTMLKMSEMEDDLTSLRLYSLPKGSLNGHDNEKSNSQDKYKFLCSEDDDDEEEIGVFHLESECSGAEEDLRLRLQNESKARHEAEDNCKKLERLVKVLRKKLAGVSISVQV